MLNRLLNGLHDLRVTVLVNDFGEISIDEALIDIRDENLIALANGCMCCQISGDLYNAIDRILQRRSETDYLVIEASGVAYPGKIGQIAVAEPELDLAQIVTVVDAANLRETLADPLLEDTVVRQLADADLLLISKVDLVDDTETGSVVDLIGSLAPNTPTLQCVFGEIPHQTLLGYHDKAIDGGDCRRTHSTERQDRHAVPFQTWSWTGGDAVRRVALREFVDRNNLGVYRLKGLVNLDDGDTVAVQKVGRDYTLKSTAKAPRESRLVAIGTPPEFSKDLLSRAWRLALER